MMGKKQTAGELLEMRGTLGILGVGMSDADLHALDELPPWEQENRLRERAGHPVMVEAHGRRWQVFQHIAAGETADVCLAVDVSAGLGMPMPATVIEVPRPEETP